jgi:GrpB-like predicted nucleotidyltransferase (UPF0157 family)
MPDDPLDGVLIGGREKVEIVVVDYDPTWPERFAELADTVRAALGARALRIEHIGSTSVPGLAAKPIIDMLVVVEDVAAEATYVPALEATGFRLRVREPDHRMLRTPGRTAHLHFFEPGHEAIAAYLDLRERLRSDAGDRDLYAATKRDLATREWGDMNEYADAKSEVIAEILGRARA